MFFVITYDIADDDRRRKVSDTLENYGTRVQESVFECHLTPAQREEVQKHIDYLIEPEVDNVRYYRVCQDCLAQSTVVGPVPLTTDPDYYLI
ncbi:MAG: CRISPR-associated endonuclease Cas2 [Deltaproteobacteria bacterium]|nr:CRISPR-associated endonuclease Cas2 [Deltaproteobacteria bacterium]